MLAHAHSPRQLTGVHGSAHRLNFFMMHKLMIFFKMFDIFNLDSTTANTGRRD